MPLPVLRIEYPAWVDGFIDPEQTFPDDASRMRLAIELARRNVQHRTGGPFGAAIFEAGSGRVVAVGMNLVVAHQNCVLHGEVVAIMYAQARLQSYTLKGRGLPTHELFTSCDPCAMCLGASLWSGVQRVVCGASRTDALALHFEEGPVFPESLDYMRARGVEVVHGVLRDEAREVMEQYRASGGSIYNP